MKLSDVQIKEIAENLDCGMVCYVNRKTMEIRSVIDVNDPYADPELWEEELNEIEQNYSDYLHIEKMPSHDAFRVMEDFALQVEDKQIRERLIYALNRNKPFRNFKYELDYNEDIRQRWFKFKEYRYKEYVRNYIRFASDEETDEDPEESIDFPEAGQPQVFGGYFDDDGNPCNPDLYPLPELCLSCKKKDDPAEEILCNLTRMDQSGEKEFKCFAYEKLD